MSAEKIGAEVRFLFNSGFTVQTGERLMIFDYYNPTPRRSGNLDRGIVSPEALHGYDLTVFASHAHMDHFNPAVLDWEKQLPDIRYVLSSDIKPSVKPAHLTSVGPNETRAVDDMTIRTLTSTDEGVAFIVETPSLKLYHAGDLNWWHWDGEPDDENADMAGRYKAEIDKLRGERFDLAFVPVDTRLGGEYLWGLDYFMSRVDANIVFPMHFFNDFSVFDKLYKDLEAKEYRGRVMRITRRGELFKI